jgi:hypothetical protein
MMRPMRSVADDGRLEARQAVLARAPAERVELALQLGDEDLAAYCAAKGIDPASATRLHRSGRQRGRRPSKCLEGLLA